MRYKINFKAFINASIQLSRWAWGEGRKVPSSWRSRVLCWYLMYCLCQVTSVFEFLKIMVCLSILPKDIKRQNYSAISYPAIITFWLWSSLVLRHHAPRIRQQNLFIFSPDCEVAWYKDTMLLESDNKIYFHKKGTLHTMTIRRLQISDFGKYFFKNHCSVSKDEIKLFCNSLQ